MTPALDDSSPARTPLASDPALKGTMAVPRRSLERDAHGQPRFRGCSSIKDYEIQSKLGEGTFGEVYRARATKTGAAVALKKILMHNEKDGVGLAEQCVFAEEALTRRVYSSRLPHSERSNY